MQRVGLTKTHRRGTTTVEFAVVAPVFIMVLFTVIEFSRVLQLQHTVRQAAFEGARAGAALDATSTDATTAATVITSAIGIVSPTITVSPNPLTYNSTTISVTVTANPLTNGWFTRFVTGTSISATVQLNREIQSVSVP
jgi:Flp pilus assembly protein TadG